MRRKVLCFFALLAFLNCARQSETPIEGTWQMVSGTYTDIANTVTITTDESKRFSLKVVGPKHFAVVEMFKENPDSLFFAAVGTYKIKGNKYIETYEASNVGYQVGTSREFEFGVTGGRWKIKSVGSDSDMALDEVWARLN